MGYWEELPLQCPPAEASEDAIELAYRVVYSNPPNREHFRSQRYLNRQLSPGGDECRHASCSLCATIERARLFCGLPKVKAKVPLIAHMSIPQGSGRQLTKKDHIDFWIYDDFDPCSAVVEVEAP